jgi:exosortase A-associated hydrolase 1
VCSTDRGYNKNLGCHLVIVMPVAEQATHFGCGVDRLVAVISRPQQPLPRGVLVVVGGPQYRAGSHRQFTLLCRALAEQGIAAMRFDYRGMGDSQGEARNFEAIGPDILAAVEHFCVKVPALREIVIWGLCDAASAALMCAYQDGRISGLVLLNPWVRTVEGLAKAQIKHYYWSRLKEREFWRKLAHGRFDYAAAVRSFVGALMRASGVGGARDATGTSDSTPAHGESDATAPLPARMADGLSRFKGRVLLILSGKDMTAREFEEVAQGSERWRRLLADARVERRKLPEANHTFSTHEWRGQVATWTANWVRSW